MVTDSTTETFPRVQRSTSSGEIVPSVSSSDVHADSVQYGVDAFDRYVAQYGRDSGRKDLLTKILVPKSLDEALTDFDVHTEIGNLVFAGTGRVK